MPPLSRTFHALSRIAFTATLSLSLPLFTLPSALAQATQQPTPAAAAPSPVKRAAVGDAPDDPGPLAHGLSPKLKSPAIRDAMKKVADWQLRVAEPKFNSQWTFAALYDGFLAASATTGDPAYRDAVFHYAEQQQWKLIGNRFPHADDMALAKAYLEIYLSEPPAERKPEQIADTKAILDRLIARPDDPAKNLWWWADALYMAPPVLVRMAQITGDHKYIDYLNTNWQRTSGLLYDKQEHLYARDATYLDKHEQNGARLFWSRGNGWVLGGLARVLAYMPPNYPSRDRYVAQFRQMVDAVAAIQGADGLWRSGLLDAGAYPYPEVSGSAFFTFAIAWGINAGLLDRKTYEPVVTRAWKGLLGHVYADGRLGSIQRIGGAPATLNPGGSWVYGVGAFLLAGEELDKLSRHPK